MKKQLIVFSMLASLVLKAEIVHEKINIKNSYYEIPAIMTYDNKIKDAPMVVMMHGTASNKNEVNNTYVKLADNLVKQGISSIRFDFIGTGDSTVNYLHYTISTAVSDANKVIDYAKTKTNGKIGVLGWSQGGTIALLSGDNKNVSSIATLAAALNMFDKEKEKQYELSKENGYFIVEFPWRSPLKFSHQWYSEVKNLNMEQEIKEITAPILSIAGEEDDVVNPNEADIIKQFSVNKQSKVLKIKKADHIFYTFDKEKSKINEVIDKTTDWFKNTLK